MTLVKKQHNGRELPVFKNMNQATEYFARRRKTIYKGINALLFVFSLVQAIFQILFHPSLASVLIGVILLAVGGLYCIIEEPKIRAPKQFVVIYSEEEGKWLIFPEYEYPAVAFVRESEYDTMKEDYMMDDYVIDVVERDLKKKVVATRIFAAGIFLSAVLLTIPPILRVAIPVGAVIIGMVILCW